MSRGTEEHGRGRTATAQRHESGRQPGVSGLTNMASASTARLWIELVQRPRHLNPAGRSAQEDDPFLDLWRRTPKAFTASAIKRAVRGRLIIEYPCGKYGRDATAEKEFAESPMPEGILRNAGQESGISNERYEDWLLLASTTEPSDAPLSTTTLGATVFRCVRPSPRWLSPSGRLPLPLPNKKPPTHHVQAEK